MTGRPRDARSAPPHAYQSYLLRMWRANLGESIVWRASLEDTRTGQWHSFADLSAAFRFLDIQTAQATANQEGDQPHDSLTERSYE